MPNQHLWCKFKICYIQTRLYSLPPAAGKHYFVSIVSANSSHLLPLPPPPPEAPPWEALKVFFPLLEEREEKKTRVQNRFRKGGKNLHNGKVSLFQPFSASSPTQNPVDGPRGKNGVGGGLRRPSRGCCSAPFPTRATTASPTTSPNPTSQRQPLPIKPRAQPKN